LRLLVPAPELRRPSHAFPHQDFHRALNPPFARTVPPQVCLLRPSAIFCLFSFNTCPATTPACLFLCFLPPRFFPPAKPGPLLVTFPLGHFATCCSTFFPPRFFLDCQIAYTLPPLLPTPIMNFSFLFFFVGFFLLLFCFF